MNEVLHKPMDTLMLMRTVGHYIGLVRGAKR
jgi:hypothetical protein